MGRGIATAGALLLLAGTALAQGAAPLKKCAPDAVIAGAVCMDAYEASVWRVPNAATANRGLAMRIQQGRATVNDLTAGGATQLGIAADNYAPCGDAGQNCTDDVFALSIPGVPPSVHVTWPQAVAACENSRKRLPSSAEWQAAVIGSPDAGPDDGMTSCNTGSTLAPVATGSRSGCRASGGAFDLVGNVWEWVADWVPRSTACDGWSGTISPTGFRDQQCLLGAATFGEPGAIIRGGHFASGMGAGPFAVNGAVGPSTTFNFLGFRCAR